MSLVSQAKFDELVTNTTQYLQTLMTQSAQLKERVEKLEAAVEAAAKPAQGEGRAHKDWAADLLCCAGRLPH